MSVEMWANALSLRRLVLWFNGCHILSDRREFKIVFFCLHLIELRLQVSSEVVYYKKRQRIENRERKRERNRRRQVRKRDSFSVGVAVELVLLRVRWFRLFEVFYDWD